MAEKKRLRMRGVKQAPKRLESEILERSRKIANDPALLRPMCAGNCRKCLFDRTFKTIDDISRYRGDAETLLKFASKGSDDMAKAYAGTISLSAAGKIPLLATATVGGEKVSFVVRGSVGNDKLIGCQYYDDPKIRLLYYNQFIKREKLHLYSFRDGLVCANFPNMPEDYLYEAFWETPYEFKDDGLDCGHKDALILDIKIKSANEHIRICENCAKEVSTVQYLISQICAVEPLDDIEISILHPYHSAKESGSEKVEGDTLKKYLRGELNDRTLLSTIKREKLGSLKKGGNSTYVIGTENYGSDLDAFVNALSGPPEEKATIKSFLTAVPESVVIRSGKTSEVLVHLWDEHWRDLVVHHTSKSHADRITEKPKNAPSQVLCDTRKTFVSADVVASLPEFKKPGPMTKLADNLAKAAKVGGCGMVNTAFASETMKGSNYRSVSAAFILAADPAAKLPLNLTPDEKSFTDFLVPFAKAVIDANGEKYRDAMNTLLTASSSGESV
ncbi:hypothetical protein Mpt1_c12770 [Candidatus Methanoplasma termitum]|uniref:Uncharacterized protein n=1 Tax=Candidatus Methanoplasma termitum TaxID=1577791 RepID=A0A0A7LDK6_9ARCH|nr:hypothetical protein [Candidatus Methanoplasma termitum]AIZ57139.1 hypothetical protein Mpt1_c12770 [Candidatus Methanoplasma termitum]MCL2334220.1 hypothetical protein [Candidatus Methanoplasma sp.]